MAETPLTDSIEALTTYANQVTGASDTNLSDAVYTLTQGYGGGGGNDYMQDLRQLVRAFANYDSTVGNNIPTTPLELTLPRCQQVERAFVNAKTFDGRSADVILHFNDESPTIRTLSYAFAYSPLLSAKITGDLSRVTNYSGMITNSNNITRLDAELDFSSCTAATSCNIGAGGKTTLTYLRYKPNTLSYSHDISPQQVLDEDSLVSIANGLNESATGQTLTLYSTRKALCDTIMGTVGMDATNTFHVFTKDSSGTVSLSDFIANTKGWTLA